MVIITKRALRKLTIVLFRKRIVLYSYNIYYYLYLKRDHPIGINNISAKEMREIVLPV